MDISKISDMNYVMLQKMDMHQQIAKNQEIQAPNQINLSFSSVMKDSLDKVNNMQMEATNKVNAVELGLSDDLIGATIANQKASLSFQMLMEVRNKFVSNLQEILKMPV